MPSDLAHFWTSSGRQRRNTASAQLEQLTHIYVSAPLTLQTTFIFFFIMPNTKSAKTQHPSGATEQSKENPKSTKSTKGFTEIDTSRLTPDQRELRRRRRSSERERAARVQRASADGDDRPDSPPSAGSKPTETRRALVVEPQGIANRPVGLLSDPSGPSTMITSGSKVERGQTTYTGETGGPSAWAHFWTSSLRHAATQACSAQLDSSRTTTRVHC